jgi:His-Xaa-Ser system protein HxsD
MSADWLDAEITGDTVALTVDERVYSVNALLRTAYWFTDRAYIFVTKPGERTLRVHLKAKAPTLDSPHSTPIRDLAGEFGNSLLDNQLREAVEEQTGKIRELLVMKAIAEAGILEDSPPGSPNDPVADVQHTNLTRMSS